MAPLKNRIAMSKQTRKRGFKSGFRVVKPSQIETTSLMPESKERERKAY